MNKPITTDKFATDLWGMMQMAIDEAVELEREECAKILDANAMACHTPIMRSLLQSNAQAVRARGQALAQPEQDGDCKKCKDGCPACDARKIPNDLL